MSFKITVAQEDLCYSEAPPTVESYWIKSSCIVIGFGFCQWWSVLHRSWIGGGFTMVLLWLRFTLWFWTSEEHMLGSWRIHVLQECLKHVWCFPFMLENNESIMHGFTVHERSLSVRCGGRSDVRQIVEILDWKACEHLTAVCVKAFILAGVQSKL